MNSGSFERYHRQMLLPGIGTAGQQRLAGATALLVGCGALGSSIADALVRAGVGKLILVDRDIVELTNLQRQVLYDEEDARAGAPKAEAAAHRLRCINSSVEIVAHVDDFNAGNAERCAQGADIIIDGLDNFETRYLLNDLAVSRGVPYVYGGAVGTSGMSMTVFPKGAQGEGREQHWPESCDTPCLRCLFPEAPPPGSTPTCDTAGVLGPIVVMIAAWQSAQALKYLTGNAESVDRRLLNLDCWSGQVQQFDVCHGGPDPECPCCGSRQFEYLSGAASSQTTSLCGRNAVQIVPASSATDSTDAARIAQLHERLEAFGAFALNGSVLRGRFHDEVGENGDAIELMLFQNGRAIIKGTAEPDTARTIYARYIGT